MLTSSAKAKGRSLQKWVKDKLLVMFPQLEEDDVRSTGMGQTGLDVQMSPKAMRFVNFGFECKNLKQMVVYKYYEQAERGTHKANRYLEPVVVLKANFKKPLAVVDAEVFFKLIRDRYDIGMVNLNNPELD